MADSTTNGTVNGTYNITNLEELKSAYELWKTTNDKLETGPYTTINSGSFKSLTTPIDIASKYIQELIQSIQEILNYSKNSQLSFQTLIDSIQATDEEEIPDPDPFPDDNGWSGGGGNRFPDTHDTPNPPDHPNEDPKEIDLSSLENATLPEIAGLVTEITDMSKKKGKGIDEIMADPNLADDIKTLLLASPYIDDELKKILTDLSSEDVRKIFLNIMNSNEPLIFRLNPLNLGIMYEYLSQKAAEKNITVEQLLTDSKYSDWLKEALSGCDEATDLFKSWDSLSNEEYQSNLLKVYDGNEIAEEKPNAVSIARGFVEYISEETEIAAEELLTDNRYAEELKKGGQELGKTCAFMGASAHYKSQETVSNLFNGKNAGALGLDEKEVTAFKKEMDTLAKNNQTSVEKLFSESSYADTVKEALASSSNAKDVGSIYKKAPSSVSQTVAKNLYNTKIQTAETSKDSKA